MKLQNLLCLYHVQDTWFQFPSNATTLVEVIVISLHANKMIIKHVTVVSLSVLTTLQKLIAGLSLTTSLGMVSLNVAPMTCKHKGI
jgi:hypothetical protein